MTEDEKIQYNEYLNELLTNKAFSIKDTGLTYRIISNWSQRGLINHFRNSDKKWHTFSFLELVELNIYKDLRRVGLQIEQLKKVKNYITQDYKIDVVIGESSYPLTPLLNNVISVLNGENINLLLDSECLNPGFYSELIFTEIAMGIGPLANEVYGSKSSLVFINLRRLLDDMRIEVKNKNSKLALIVTSILDDESENSELVVKIENSDGGPSIKKIKKVEYKNFKDVNNLKTEINKPNQKTTIHSNASGAHKISIESEIK